MKKRFFAIAMLLLFTYGSLVTVHANTPHRCSKFKDNRGNPIAHECRHATTTLSRVPEMPVGPVELQEPLRSDEDPTLPPPPWCDTDPNSCRPSPCDCPWSSWDCFINTMTRDQLLTKQGLSQVAHHGPFNLW